MNYNNIYDKIKNSYNYFKKKGLKNMEKSKIRNISYLLLTLFVIVFGIFVLTTNFITPLYSLLFVIIFAVWGFLTDILTRSENADKENK